LVLGRDKEIARFVAERTNTPDFGACAAIGVIRRGKLAGGVVFHEFRPQYKSVMASFAADDPMWLSPSVLCSLFTYPFLQLGCMRIGTMAARRNKRSRKVTVGLGFRMEGCVRRGFGNDDGILYGMLRRECRWLET